MEAAFIAQYRDRITRRADVMHLHVRNYTEIYSFLGGEGPYFCFADDILYELQPGDVMILRPGVLHGGCKKLQARYCRLYVRLPADVPEMLEAVDPSLADFLRNDRTVLLHPTGDDAREYAALTEQIRLLGESQLPHVRTVQFGCVLAQLAILSRCRGSTSVCRHDELIGAVLRTVNTSYASLTSAADIAARLNYSTGYLSSRFRDTMQMGLHDFLLMKKLAVAAAELITGKSVTACALDCGFSSAAYFISVFRKHYGVTPAHYAAQFSENR